VIVDTNIVFYENTRIKIAMINYKYQAIIWQCCLEAAAVLLTTQDNDLKLI